MAQIRGIPNDHTVDLDDKLLGSSSEGKTRNYNISLLLDYFRDNIGSMSNAEIVAAINTELGGTTWQSSGGLLTGAEIVTAIDSELGSTVWKFDNDTQLTNAEVVTAINTELGNTNWQTDTDTNTQLTNAEVVTAVNAELGNTNWQTDTNTQLTNNEVVTAINTQLGNTDWQTDTNTQLTASEVIAAIDGSIGTGWKREDFATSAQGTKADSAVQTTGGNYSFANVISYTLVNLTISEGSVNWNADGRNLHKIVLTGNCTLENGLNPISGTQYQFIVEQDATGGHALSYGNLFKFPGAVPPTIPTTPYSKSIITCLFDGTHYLAMSVLFSGEFLGYALQDGLGNTIQDGNNNDIITA